MNTKALRQKILDLAIRGKLVPQDPNDEPASVLLERIRAEKQQMVKEGKLKAKDIKNDTIIYVGEDNLHYEKFQDGSIKCIEDEIPFELPEGWAWCHYSDVINLYSGQDLTPDRYNDTGDGIPYITGASNLEHGKVIINRWTTTPTTHATTGDLLLTVKGSGVGKMAFCDIIDAHIARQIMALRCTSAIIPQYLHIAISAMLNDITAQANGIIPGIRREIVLGAYLPLPPISEQEKICTSADNSLHIIDNISTNKEDLKEIIQTTKSKILDLAIRGKLVPQNSDDEPASVLLERIRAEKEELIKQGKLKHDKKESVIFKGEDNSYYEKIGDAIRCIDEEIPFDIPSTWTFVRLKHIGMVIGGGTPKTNIPSYWDGEIPWLTPADFSGFKAIYISSGARKITQLGLEASSAQLMPTGTVLYSSRAPIGYTAIAANPIATNQGFKSVVPYNTSMSEYIYYCLKARTAEIERRATGTTFKEISGSAMAEIVIPLPPLAEQQFICSKLKAIISIISCIEKSLS